MIDRIQAMCTLACDQLLLVVLEVLLAQDVRTQLCYSSRLPERLKCLLVEFLRVLCREHFTAKILDNSLTILNVTSKVACHLSLLLLPEQELLAWDRLTIHGLARRGNSVAKSGHVLFL